MCAATFSPAKRWTAIIQLGRGIDLGVGVDLYRIDFFGAAKLHAPNADRMRSLSLSLACVRRSLGAVKRGPSVAATAARTYAVDLDHRTDSMTLSTSVCMCARARARQYSLR